MSMNRIFGKDPRNPAPAKRAFPDVKVYFIGTYHLKQVEKMNGKLPSKLPMQAEGNGIFYAPAVGDYLTVPQNVAQSLIRSNRHEYPKGSDLFGQTEEAWTLDPQLAKAVKDSWETGKPVSAAQAELLLADVTDDAFEKEVIRRAKLKAKQEKLDAKKREAAEEKKADDLPTKEEGGDQ